MATWFLKEVFPVLLFCTLRANVCFANIHQFNGQYDAFNMVQGKSIELGSSVDDLSVHHQRRKRDLSQDQKCSDQNSLLQKSETTPGFHYENTLLNDTLRSLSLSWKTDTLLAVTTEETWIFSKQSKVYLSTDGGKTFKLHEDSRINSVLIKRDNGLQKHPRDTAKVYLVAYSSGAGSTLFTSSDAGRTFYEHVLPFNLVANLMFHPEEDNVIMTLSARTLYITKDNGETWQDIQNNVVDAKWDTETKSIYCSVWVVGIEKTDYNLEVSHDNGASWSVIHKNIYSFGVQGKFVYVSTYMTADDQTQDNRMMEVSTNRGVTWNAVQMPAIEPDRFYSILDMSFGMVFLHVDEPENSGFGTLFTSDSTGILYSKSMERHLYPNYQDVTDFYRVQGMRGVYLASQMANDNTVHTMITYDRGGEWKHIPRPAGPCVDESKECYLQIHGTFSRMSGVRANTPLSSENAKGLILVHGHIASSLQTTNPDVFLSYNGGYDWKKVLTGPHHYQIADQGGLIVAVPLVNYPKVIKYSLDEGNCWHEYIFTDKNLTITGLLTEPGNMQMGVSVWGYTDDRMWIVHTFNFSKIVTKACTQSDYETWQPHANNQKEGCFLGQKETFTKIKKDSMCHNTKKLDMTHLSEPCLCTSADYECDYGYYRPQNSENCILDPMFKGGELKICERNHVEEIVTLGYHKIPGDTCTLKNSRFHKAEHKMIDMHKVCVEGDTSLLDDQVKDKYLAPENKSHTMRTNTVVLIVALTILLLAGVIIVAFFAHRNLFNRSAAYRYSMLRVNEYDNDVEEALATHTSLYDDFSDEESRPITSSKKNSTPQLGNGVLPRFDQMSSTRPPQQQPSGHMSGTSGHPTLSHTSPAVHPSIPPVSHRPTTRDARSNLPKVKSYHDDSDVDLLE